MEPGKTIKGNRLKFVREYVKTGNGTRSVMKVYNNPKEHSAGIHAVKLLKHPLVIKSIEEHLAEAGYNPTDSVKALQKASGYGLARSNTATVRDSIRANELLLKISGKLVDRKQSVRYDISSKNINELLKLKQTYDKLLSDR